MKRKDVRQAELLDQVLALFLEHGYENVSLNAGVAASYQVKMAMGAAEQVAAMTSLLRLHNQALFERIVAIWEDLFK
ncbi:hypothetical protein [Mycobacterium xenopi]|uniref:hypothetical protein n=1 Tax=Mycobacterium xenopi TaxID=1789 RepID=UPI00030A4230|nr:hypothetical protein [Mycobacterium xenopi]MDA3639475.1 hypothetical protein [Mycobacterium xenopi]MDA3657711.1 hypothetical protein [Mycobacterium xenopi]MDA3663052.1 hypothetical protein [Mycobacterium xenopi]